MANGNMDIFEEHLWRFWVRLALRTAPLALAGLAALLIALAASGRTTA